MWRTSQPSFGGTICFSLFLSSIRALEAFWMVERIIGSLTCDSIDVNSLPIDLIGSHFTLVLYLYCTLPGTRSDYVQYLYLQVPVNSGYLLYVAWTPALDNGRRGATTKTQAGVIYSIDSPIAKAFSLRRASTEVAYICLEVLKSLIEMPGLDTVWTLPGHSLDTV